MAIEQQFDVSPHGFGNFEVRGPTYAGGSCAACHTSQGFVASATGGTADYSGGVASMNCRTCHQIHATGEAADYALTTTDPVTLLVTGTEIDLGGVDVPGSNLCINCHQARTEDTYPQYDAPVSQLFTVPSSHYDFHYGSQANVFTANFPAEVMYGRTANSSYGPHEDASCLGCHMGLGSEVADFGLADPLPGGSFGHNYTPGDAVCESCHQDEESFDHNGIRTDVDAGIVALAACLAAEGVVTLNPADGHDFHVVVGDHPEPYVAAYMVAGMLEEDGSLGAHNPPFITGILDAARTAMDANSSDPACDYTP